MLAASVDPENETTTVRMRGARRPWLWVVVCLLLAGSVLALYWPVRHHGFVSYDDPSYVTENPMVKAGLSWSGLKWAFTTSHAGYWHPITWLSHMLDVQMFGLHAAGPHLVSVILHVANTLLVLLALHRLTGAFWRSAFVAAIFALHPLHVESVAWIAERKDVLSAFFFLLTLWAYGRYVEANEDRQSQTGATVAPVSDRRPTTKRRTARWFIAALIAFALGLLSKPMVVTLPCVLLLLDFWPLRRLSIGDLRFTSGSNRGRRTLLEKIPFFLIAAASAIVTSINQKHDGTLVSLSHFGLGPRIGNAFVSYARYLGKTFWPVDLAVLYPHPGGWPRWYVLSSVALLLVLFVVAVWCARKRPFVTVGWFWFFGMLVPTIGLVQVGVQAMADRYTYLPMLGLLIALVWMGYELAMRWRVPAAAMGGLALAVLVACARVTSAQVAYWQNDETLYGHTLAVTERNSIIENNLGGMLLEKGRLDEAFAHVRRALDVTPNEAKANNNMGDILWVKGRPEEALPHFERAARSDPKFAEAHANLGRTLLQLGRVPEAIVELEKAVHLRPTHAEAHYRLGSALMQVGRADEAMAHFQRTIAVMPDSIEAHNDMGVLLIQKGQVDEALAEFRKTVEINPDFAEGRSNVARVLQQKGLLHEAVKSYRAALKLEPSNPDTLASLAWILATSPDPTLRSGTEAAMLAQRANQHTGNRQPMLLRTLAAAYAEVGRFPEAISTIQRAIELATNQADGELVNVLRRDFAVYADGSPLRDRGSQPAANERDAPGNGR